MKTTLTTLAAGAIAVTMVAATPVAAQSYRDYRDRDRTSSSDVLVGAAIGAVAGAALGNGDGAYIAGGALAGAAIAASNDGDRYDRYDNRYDYRRGDCSYYRDGRCWRNQGHWERENRDRAFYGGERYREGQSYRQGYYRDGRFWRNHGEWRSYQNRNRDYRYERRW